MNTAVDGRSQAEEDAFHARLNAANCLLYENDPGEARLNVGTPLKPLLIPRSEAWQQSYSMRLLRECNGDKTRLLGARQECVKRQNESYGRGREVWSRAADLCDQAVRMIEGNGAVTDDKARRILIAVCEYENMKTSLGLLCSHEDLARDLTEALRELSATMEDVPSAESLVSWAFPWL